MEQSKSATPEPEHSENDPRTSEPGAAESSDPHAGVSDDPRVDPTPDRRHTK